MDIRGMSPEGREKLKKAILDAVAQWPSRYETESGEVFMGRLLEDAKSDMIRKGWRGISGWRLDADDVKQLGIRVVRARYIGGVRKKGFAHDVIYLEPVPQTSD